MFSSRKLSGVSQTSRAHLVSHYYKDFDETSATRAQLVCDTPDSLRDENRYLERVFHKNNYNADFVKRNIPETYRPTEADATNRKPTPLTTVTIPYIKGTSETISRILQPYNVRVAHKPTSTLRQLLTNVKDRDEPNDRTGSSLQDQMLRLPGFLYW